MNRLVLLDCDGTLIINKHYLNDPKDIEYLPGVEKALQFLKGQGFRFAVVTNQSGIPRGKVQEENLYEIHRQIKYHFKNHGVELEKFYFSPHLPDSDHPTRKPNPGMLHQALLDLEGDIEGSWMIGDKMSDVEAGHRAQLKAALLGDEIGQFPKDWPKAEAQGRDWPALIQNMKDKI